MARLLLARGAAVGAAARSGATPLHLASEWGHLKLVRELLARGASPRATAKDGSTALSLAIRENHEGIATLLRDALLLG